MSTYDDDEKSVQDARPAELYTITTPTTVYHLTSYSQNIVYSGVTYTTATIRREAVTMDPLGKTREVVVSISLDHALAQDLLVGGVPWSGVTIEIDCLMQRSGVARMLHIGQVNGISSDGQTVKLQAPGKLDVKVAGVMLPVLQSQRLCQHGLYDTGCTLNPASSQIAPTVSTISADGLTITVSTIAGQPDQWAQYGKITRNADSEPRAVVSQVGTTIIVDVPFRALSIGDTVTINAGCDHVVTTCRDKFNNVINFGGHPVLPTVNIQSPTGIGVLQQT